MAEQDPTEVGSVPNTEEVDSPEYKQLRIDNNTNSIEDLQFKIARLTNQVSDLSTSGIRVLGQTFSNALAPNITPDVIVTTKWTATASSALKTLCAAMYFFTAGNKITMALYSDNGAGNYPVTRLAVTDEHTLITADLDSEIHLDLVSPVELVKGTNYWIAWNVDTNNYNMYQIDAAARATHGLYKVLAYDGTMPTTFPVGGIAGARVAVSGLT